ncbi:MAG: ABC transporter permease [Actinomycetota bacterium]
MPFLRRALNPVREARGWSAVAIWLGVALTLLFVVLAIFAPFIAPYGPTQYQGIPGDAPPSAAHIMGTTKLGYDVFSRVVYGARYALLVVLLATVVAMGIGVPTGLISGYTGGKLDRVLVMLMDAIYAFPGLLLAIVIAFVARQRLASVLHLGVVATGLVGAALAISVIYVPQYYRVVRNHVISVKEEPYVEAARALGARPWTVIRRYIFVNVVQSVPVIFTLNAADAILTLAGLGFLGYGLHPPTPEWGWDLSKAIGAATSGIWWQALYPGLAITLLCTGLTLLGEGLNDVVNPLLRSRGAAAGPAAVPSAMPEVGAKPTKTGTGRP